MLAELITRIRGMADRGRPNSDDQSILHAYVACLSFPDLCEAIAETIDGPTSIRLALRSRLVRLLRYGTIVDHGDALERLAAVLIEQATTRKDIRRSADSFASVVFPHLPASLQQPFLDHWADRGTRAGMVLWLKAVRQVPALFDPDLILTYWRHTRDDRAARMLAYDADVGMLLNILPELLRHCDTGWILSKAVIRAGGADEEGWALIRERHPATYLYLCSQTGRTVVAEEAFELVCRCSLFEMESGRGLAIWAVGQMKMVDVLDRLAASTNVFEAINSAQFAERYLTG